MTRPDSPIHLPRRRLIAAGAGLGLAAFAGRAGAADAPAAAASLVLGDQANSTRARLEAAGALDGAPFRYTWANFQGAAPLFEAVRAGAVDTAPAGDTPVLAAAAQNSRVRIVATTVGPAKSVAIVVQGNSPIRSVADLKGRSVVVSSARGSIAQYLLIGALREAGVDPASVDVRFVMPTEALPAFRAGQIDAWATFDPYLAVAEDAGGRVLRDGEGISTGRGFLTASEKALADPAKRAAIRELIARMNRAWDWSQTNRAAYERVYAEQTRLSPAIVSKVLARSYNALRAVNDGDVLAVQKVADVFAELNLLPRRVDVRGLVEPEFFARGAA
ncbi:ABC transporter substrate-binding protein [Derxia gummosa]|uniref:Putative aliphatic sulfonates-binding protein n=1 Tax=Derxia gummosa DSM 723 TaxID=1121388 RepID=A0A8B6X3U1_9BURK|nr:ABC transporter substrate-binding protein [Derxia gummosa]